MNLVERLRNKGYLHRDTINEAADRIEQLEAEVERKISAGNYVLEQLAAHEATIKTMREALDSFEPYDSFESLWSGPEPEVVDSALSIPAPTDHLIVYRSEVLEEAAKVAESEVVKQHKHINEGKPFSDHMYWEDIAAAIRAMKEKK
jgi:hypothetical protein